MYVNREHKSTVFSELFSKPDVLRELYSAIEGVSIPPDIPVSVNTLSDALINGRLNDVSFTIDNRFVVLIEHQSTINHNMPLRLLEYIADIYKTMIDQGRVYQKTLIKIPRPEFIVLYNGKEHYPEKDEVRLSKAFKSVEGLKLEEGNSVPLELVAQVYNINHGQNRRILEKCATLEGYSILIAKIREYGKKIPLEESVKEAIKYCINNNILKEYLEKRKGDVMSLLYYEYDHDLALEVTRKEAREQGLEEGREEGIQQGLQQGLEQGLEQAARNALAEGIPIDTIQKITGLSIREIEKLSLN